MPCVRLTGGGFACGVRWRAKLCSCGRGRATLLCDWKVDGGTCDAEICPSCSTIPAPGKDLCPAHAEVWETWKAAKVAERT